MPSKVGQETILADTGLSECVIWSAFVIVGVYNFGLVLTSENRTRLAGI